MEEKKNIHQKQKRRISLFKKRKKVELRPFVKETKIRKKSKFISFLFVYSILLVLILGSIYLIIIFVVPRFFLDNKQIINPQGTPFLSRPKVEQQLQTSGFNISGVMFYEDTIFFTLDKRIGIYFLFKKDMKTQLDLMKAINDEVKLSGKQAISIDLRYNKPIVKF